ncbi:Transcription factor SPT20 homolog [Apodemus speciosus]|uniref:Transcription factor SPT20 homolog n=1 Tax=Apodemus speciosus TaxID=105296 RepID=A0ABQ0FV53_APOSI
MFSGQPVPRKSGLSLMLKDKDGILIEPFPVPYLGQKLLEYLDAEELPSFLIDVLEKSPVNVFHHGCVIAEIRDYRQCSDIHPPGELRAEPAVSSDVSSAASSAETSAELSAEPSAESSAVSSTMPSTTPPPAYQTRHILLRPTMQSLVSDVESITSDNRQWTEEEKLELESQLILATAEPLCLDPSVAVACTANRLLFNEQKMMTDPMRQCFTSHDWPYLQLEEGQYICTTPPDVSTMVACRKRAEPKPGDQYDLKIAEAGKCVDTWKQRPCELAAPGEVDVHKYARGKQAVPCDDAESTAWSPPEVKYDYPFECDEGSQLWEAQPSTSTAQAQPLSEPFFSPEVRPPTGGRCDSQMYLPLVAPSDHSGGSVAGEGIEPGKATGVGQGSVQRTAECLSKILQGSTDSFPLGQPSQGKKVTSHSVSSPALEKRVNTPAPLLTQPSTSGQGSSAVSSPPLRGRKLPRLATSPKSASSAQQTFWGVSGVGTLPSAAQSSASSTESSSAATQRPSSGTGQNVINLLGLAQRGPVLVSSPSQVLSFPTAAPASTETSSRGFLPPPRSQMLSAQSRAPQRSVQTSLKLIVKNTSGPVTVRLPPGSVILHPESQAQRQQPWPQPQQPKSQQQPRPQPQQSQPQLVQQAQPRQPQLLQQAQPRQAQLVQQAQSRQAQLVQQAQSRQAQLVQQAQSRQAQLVQQVQSRQAQLLQQVQSRQAQLLQQAQPRQAQLKRQAQLVQQAQPRQPQLKRQAQLVQQAQPRQPQLLQQAQPRQLQPASRAQPRQAQPQCSRPSHGRRSPSAAGPATAGAAPVQQVRPRQAQLLQQAQPRQAQLVQQVQPRQAQLLQQASHGRRSYCSRPSHGRRSYCSRPSHGRRSYCSRPSHGSCSYCSRPNHGSIYGQSCRGRNSQSLCMY